MPGRGALREPVKRSGRSEWRVGKERFHAIFLRTDGHP